jgi:hypothetical protein
MGARQLAAAAIAAAWIGAVHAQGSAAATDWATVGRFLSLLQFVVNATAAECPPGSRVARGCTPDAGRQAIDDILSGRNAEANALALELFADVPGPEREKLAGLGRSFAALSRKHVADEEQAAAEARAIRARKDLAGMGLTYHDPGQFLEAVRRSDVLAVKLFLAGRGVDPNATDPSGRSALELAQRGGNPELIALLAAASAPSRPGQQSP